MSGRSSAGMSFPAVSTSSTAPCPPSSCPNLLILEPQRPSSRLQSRGGQYGVQAATVKNRRFPGCTPFTEHTAPELLYLETRWASLEFIPIKPLAATGSGGAGSYAG